MDPGATPAMLEAILERGADPNVLFGKEPDTYRALELCVCNNMPDKIEVLMRHGADPYLTDSEGDSAMSIAQHSLASARDLSLELPDAPYGMSEQEQERHHYRSKARSVQKYEAMVAILKGGPVPPANSIRD